MRLIDLHLLAIAILGLGIFGLGLRSQLGVLGVFVVAQFILVTRNLIGKERHFKKFAVNEALVILLSLLVFLTIKS